MFTNLSPSSNVNIQSNKGFNVTAKCCSLSLQNSYDNYEEK